MKQCLIKIILLFSFAFVVHGSSAQPAGVALSSPFDFPLYLSGNFGELRSNHFHSGIDFKTQGVTGLPIKCVADGYICRVSVTPGGYGKALYVMHDNGCMTVYGHLESFPEEIERRVRASQYKKERFSVSLWFKPSEFRVREGDILARAGNTGYSFGPHLHFEVRDASGNELYDPLVFYKDRIKDTRAPKIHSLAVYPRLGKGAVFGGAASRTYDVVNGAVADTIEAWGDIAFGIKALDYMDGTHNKYGVYRIELIVDGKCRFSSVMDNFSFSEDLLINAWLDYGRLQKDNEWYQKLFISPNNPLRALSAGKERGWITVDEERLYKVECKVSDLHGNTSVYSFAVRGKEAPAAPMPKASHTLYWATDNRVDYLGMRLDVPRGVLFENAFLNLGIEPCDAFSWRYNLADTVYPMLRGAKLSIWVGKELPVDASKLYIRHIEPDDTSSVGGTYAGGWLTADIKCLDSYEVAVDTVAPALLPQNRELWSKNGVVSFKVEENETSMSRFLGKLDGRFILFEYNSKNKLLTLDLKRESVKRGTHRLHLAVADECGNESVFDECIEY